MNQNVTNRRPRRTLRFSVTALFVILSLFGVLFASVSQRFQYAKRQTLVVELVSNGVGRHKTSDNLVGYSYEYDSGGKWIRNAQSHWPEFIIRRAGKDFLHSVESLEVIDSAYDAEELKQIGRLSDLRELCLIGCDLTSEDMEHLKELRKLTYLDVLLNRIGDDGLQYVRNMKQLKHLDVQYQEIGCGITDEGLKHLGSLEQLEYLGLSGNAITDAGIEAIGRLRNLKQLVLLSTQVTREGEAKLKRLLPECKVGIARD